VRVHYAGFTVFATTTVHALSTGADSRSPAFLLAVVSACVRLVEVGEGIHASLHRPLGKVIVVEQPGGWDASPGLVDLAAVVGQQAAVAGGDSGGPAQRAPGSSYESWLTPPRSSHRAGTTTAA
jgi:hypothetical protein